MTTEDVRIHSEIEAISAHLRPIFTVESKRILLRDDKLAKMIHEYTQRPLRYCNMYVSQMSPMAIVATWHKLNELKIQQREMLG